MKKHVFRVLSMIVIMSIMMTMLLVPVSAATDTFSSFRTKIINIENKAIQFLTAEAAPTSPSTVNDLVLDYIRSKSSYQGAKWTAVAGPIDTVFVNFVDEAYPTYDNFFRNSGEFMRDPRTGANIDFRHLCATIHGYVSATNPTPDSWSGWAGDCAQLAIESIGRVEDPNDYDQYLAHVMQYMGSNYYEMSISDMLADIDAANIANMINSNYNLFLSDALVDYYTSTKVNTRYSRFINSFGEYYEFEAEVYEVLDPNNAYVAGYSLMEIMAVNYNEEDDPVPTRNQSYAVAGTFVNFVFTKAIDEGYTFD